MADAQAFSPANPAELLEPFKLLFEPGGILVKKDKHVVHSACLWLDDIDAFLLLSQCITLLFFVELTRNIAPRPCRHSLW